MFESQEKLEPYHYFDTPDGEDIGKKLWAVLKPTALAALGASIVDMTLHSQPKNYMGALTRAGLVSAPFLGVTIAFVLVTNLAAKFRKEDDRFNWILGGTSAGVTFGTCCKSPITALYGGALLGLAGFVKKSVVDTDTPLYLHSHGHMHSSSRSSDIAYVPHTDGGANVGDSSGNHRSWLSLLGLGEPINTEEADTNDLGDEFDDDDDDYEQEEDENDEEL